MLGMPILFAKIVALLKPKRRWAQFSLGTMFVVVAVICVWLAVVVSRAHRQRDAVAAITAHHGLIKTTPLGPGWLARWLGPEYTARVTSVDFATKCGSRYSNADFPSVTDAELAPLAALPDVRVLELGNNPALTDEALFYLRGSSYLETLEFYHSQVKGEGLAYLSGLRRLTALRVGRSPLADAGLVHVESMTQLQYLMFDDTEITDAGLIHLRGLTNLVHLSLDGSNVTAAGVAELQKALPNCTITR